MTIRPMNLFAIMLLMVSVSMAQGQRTFRGKWNNHRYGTSGTLNCVASEVSTGQWKATFTGVFQGDPFKYDAAFQSRPSGGGSELGGTTTVRGSQYKWTGFLRGRQLNGKYTSTVGYYGEFVLNEIGNSPAQPPRSTTPSSPEPLPPTFVEDVEIAPVIRDGERMLFVGNSYMANEGGVYNYLAKALARRGTDITTDSKIFYGKPLRDMVTPEVGRAITASDVDSVVITSGDPVVMRQFHTKLKDTGKKLIVFMTWEAKHPGNQATPLSYKSATRRAVKTMRELEKETGVTVLPAAVLYHELTSSPPAGVPRVDYLWRKRNIHQNELGTMVNAWLMYAMLTGESPVGVNFDMPPHIVGQKIAKEPDLRLTRDLRLELQRRTWQVAQAWTRGKCHLE